MGKINVPPCTHCDGEISEEVAEVNFRSDLGFTECTKCKWIYVLVPGPGKKVYILDPRAEIDRLFSGIE